MNDKIHERLQSYVNNANSSESEDDLELWSEKIGAYCAALRDCGYLTVSESVGLAFRYRLRIRYKY